MPRIEQIRAMLEAEPDDVFLNYSLAMELAAAGDTDQALATFARVVALDPNYVAAYFHQGKMLLEARRYPEAKAALEQGRAVAKAVGNPHMHDQIRALLDLVP